MSAPQSQLLSAMGTGFELIRTLSEAAINHGGGDGHLKRLLKEPTLVAQIAKLLVGDVWKYAETPFSLEVDWTSDIGPFSTAAAQTLKIAPGLFDGGWSGYRKPYFYNEQRKKPIRFQYRLAHFEHPVTVRNVFQENCAVAGYRELCAFMRTFSLPAVTKIVALGSPWLEDTEDDKTYVCGHFFGDSDKNVAWIRQPTYSPDWFFLVRDSVGIEE